MVVFHSSPRGPGSSIRCVVGLGRLPVSRWRGIQRPSDLSGRTATASWAEISGVEPWFSALRSTQVGGVSGSVMYTINAGGVSLEPSKASRVPAAMTRRRRRRADPASADSSSTFHRCSPNGHLPRSDLAVVVVRLRSVGRLLLATDAAVGLPSSKYHL